MAAFVRWIQPPTNIAAEIARRSGRTQQRLTAAAYDRAEYAEGQMQSRAPWNDRTGNARAGLFGNVAATGDVIEIVLGGSVDYQIFLELGTSRMSPRPIIVPVQKETAAAYAKDAAAIVRDEFGG